MTGQDAASGGPLRADCITTVGAAHRTDADLAVVVIATDAPAEVREAVQSLLGQDDRCEIVVVNTGEGGVVPLLGDLAARVMVVECATRQWPGGARNIGLAHTRAPIVAFLAADCLAAPDWVRRRVRNHRQGHAAVASALRPAPGADGEVARAAWAIYALMHSRRMPETPPQSALRYGVSYDRTLFDRFGPFRDDIRIAEDTEFNRRIMHEAKPVWRPNIVTLHRNPETVWTALADQFVRGRRAAAWSRADLARSPWESFRAAPARARQARQMIEHTEGDVRAGLEAARPLFGPLSCAYGLGALSLYLRKPPRPAPAAPGAPLQQRPQS
ncbi:MAG: hypothetical protein AcusKO_16260 [Acuticoccus sp.]